MIYRISIQENSKGVDREVYFFYPGSAIFFLINEGFKCARESGPGETSLWIKDEPETVFNPARRLKAQIHQIKTID